MSESLKSALIAAVMRLLVPLVKLLLEAGIGVGEFHQLAKRAYVRAALERADGTRPSISSIATLTGLSRGEVATLSKAPTDEAPTAERGRHRAERVLQGWWHDAEFLDHAGRPLPLPLRGAKRSFTALVKRHSGDPRVATLLDELTRVRAVRQRPDGLLEVLSRTFVTARWDAGGIQAVGERVHDLLATLVHNLKHPHMPRYERFVVSNEVSPRYVPMLLRDITAQADVLAEGFQDALTDPQHSVKPGKGVQDARRVGLAVYVVDEPTLIEPATAAHRSRRPS
jgi:hypothetical protein